MENNIRQTQLNHIWGDHADSLVNRLQDSHPLFLDHMLDIPDSVFGLDENELEDYIKPSDTHRMLRASFQMEIDKCLGNNRKLNLTSIYTGICSSMQWQRMLKDRRLLGYLLIPFPEYSQTLNMLAMKAVSKFNEILSSDIEDAHGNLCPRKAEIVRKVAVDVLDRKYGQSVQRQETVNANLTGKEAAALASKSGRHDLAKAERIIRELGESPIEVIEATAEENS